MKSPQILWIGVGLAIACVSGCASTNAPSTALKDSPAVVRQHEERAPTQSRKDTISSVTVRQKSRSDSVQGQKDTPSPATARQPVQSHGVKCDQYDTCAAMATIRYHDRIGRDLDKAWQRTEQVQKLLNTIRSRK
jgi:hypothetical protein